MASPNDDINHEFSSRKLLLDFYSSQISTHSRIFIGFSALMFTILNVRVTLFDTIGRSALKSWQLIILYGFVLALGFIIFFVLFRTIGYGILANATIHVALLSKLEPIKGKSRVFPFLKDVSASILDNDHANKILFFFPIDCFFNIGGHRKQWKGFLISLGISTVVTFLIMGVLEA